MEPLFQKQTGLTLEQSLSQEWLETNSRGCYASATLLCSATRKYHGLLVSPVPRFGPMVLLAQIEDQYHDGDRSHPISAQQYHGFFQDGSFAEFQSFSNALCPSFQHQFGETFLTREYALLPEEDTLLIRYFASSGKGKARSGGKLTCRPLFAYRPFHSLRKEDATFTATVDTSSHGIHLHFSADLPDFDLDLSSPFEFTPDPSWYRHFEYPLERARGYNDTEDLFSPGILTFSLGDPEDVILACSASHSHPSESLSDLWKKEGKRRKTLIKTLSGSPLQQSLKKASASFIRRDPSTQACSITAGYPWFGAWGRDSLIAAPGLLLSTGDSDTFLKVLSTASQTLKNGLIANVWGETPEQHAYNSVDTSLWFAWAAQQYYSVTRNPEETLEIAWEPLLDIFEHYRNGTDFAIRMDPETGLLSAGTPETNLTWMDAVVDRTPVTSRHGYAVEVNALWFNFLCFLKTLAKKKAHPVEAELGDITRRFIPAFLNTFWNPSQGYLYDCVSDGQGDPSLRPNQVLAVSLPFSPLRREMAERVIQTVCDTLLTPVGLRTLAPLDPRYEGAYSTLSDPSARDRAYHNGTVWPWLLGPLWDALGKVMQPATVARMLSPCLTALNNHLNTTGVRSIAEIFDGDPPHRACGAISQAFSVAEVLRMSQIVEPLQGS